MWGAISRFFHKNDGHNKPVDDIQQASVMDRGEKKRFHENEQETFETRQAKQRATVKWILSKAFNNRVPENLREPFYKDHEDQEHLKPQLVHYLANAELYCLALSNIYSDPNYNNLNHCGVLQALARKGVFISDPHITETTLIQTNPIKLSAHQVVMQAVMTVYAKEVGTPDLVVAAVRRFLPSDLAYPDSPGDHEQSLLLWINQAVIALKLRADQEEMGVGKCPEFPRVNQLQDLCDGASLAALVAFYCPEELHWSNIKVSQVPTVSDCVRNLTLVSDFCSAALPHSIFHMAPEDVYYLRGSMKQNLVVFLADLFNLLEIHPAKCVTLNSATTNNFNAEGRNKEGVAHKRCLPQAVSAIPDLRTGLDAPSSFSGSPIIPSGNLKKVHHNHQNDVEIKNGGDEFVVHRGKSVPTLSSVIHQTDSPIGGSPVRHPEAAGKPSNWDSNRKQSFAGRRSRRNSLSDDSQLTLENFGGSQENIHLLGRNPDKEPAVHSGRRESSARSSVLDNNSMALHSALQETYNLQQQGMPEAPPRTSLSRNNSFVESQRRAQETRSSAGLQQSLLDPSPPPTPQPTTPQPTPQEVRPAEREKKVTTFAALPNNTTTWQQQSLSNQANDSGISSSSDINDGGVMGSQLINIRMKLEEKRRRIESEKRRMEAHMNRQRQKLGKAAFLQAVSKGKVVKSPESDPGGKSSEPNLQSENKPPRPFSLQDITEVEQKWLRGENFTEERKTPDLDNMDIETYQQSIAQMNSSLHEIQADLARLANQQNQIQSNQVSSGIPQAQPSPPPQMQSFASLHHQQQQQSNYNNQVINYSSPAPHINYVDPHHQQQQQHHHQQQQQHHHQQQHGGYGQQEYGEPGVLGYPNGGGRYHQAPPPPQHSLIPQQQQESYKSQQWHSLNQHPQHQPPPQPNYNNYPAPPPRYNQGFSLHGNSYGGGGGMQQDYGGGGEFYLHEPQPTHRRNWGQPYTPDTTSWPPRREPVSLSSSPKQSTLLVQNGGGDSSGGYRTSPPSLAPTPPPRTNVNHAPIPTPPVDDMEPQSISFIGKAISDKSGSGEDEQLSTGLSRLNITSGNRTYRIPSPTRNYPSRNSIPQEKPEKGFYISFDDDTPPKRPKPPLRMKRNSPKKERGLTQVLDSSSVGNLLNNTNNEMNSKHQNSRNGDNNFSDNMREEMEEEVVMKKEMVVKEEARVPPHHQPHNDQAPSGMGIVIGGPPDPTAIDEMEKKKERILMLSLQRRQAAEEARNHKEMEAARRRDMEKQKEEEKLRKKEDEKRRRAQILEQYKVKKAIEEAEREGKQVDKELLNSLKAGLQGGGGGGGSGGGGGGGGPKLRGKTQPTRPRPKTIHIDSGGSSQDAHDGTITPSRGKKGSSSNLSVFGSPMRRDYYRGSQDCLTETRKPSPRSLYAEMGDESRGTSPGRSLGRRSSYKTSRDASPDVRTLGRSKYGTYQAHRKSNSLMNLTGSSCDQDSLAYRYGDTDSGLGRATPRAPSPSGPGSLPVRRRFDDSVSDTGSDYSGPRLYKQPTTKSNKGIVLNAVEYCVFPGVVNREAKRRVLEEINRAEAKHFLVLFRDAGCQFRALYAYFPDTEEVSKLYGTGPKQVTDRMFDKFFKYNSGGKCFSQVHTKHLTVTIDAFTIHNSLWQGKKVNLPNKRDMTLVI